MINLLTDDRDDFIPVGLLILAEQLRHQYPISLYKPKVRLINQTDYNKAATDILKGKPSIVGFSTWCITYPASVLVAREIKKIAPQVSVVFGGPQASILAVETLQSFPFVDFILTGESDFTFSAFVNELFLNEPDFSKIAGLVFRNRNGEIIKNQTGDWAGNPDDLPMPAFDLAPKTKVIKLDVGRGCPFHCTYCTTNDFFSKKYRLKSTERIIAELLACHKATGVKSFAFIHDMFTLNKKTVSAICRNLIEMQEQQNLYFKWSCSARTDCVSKEMLTEMKKAGCEIVFFGIESGSEKIQKSIRKNLNLQNVHEVADWCREIGLKMVASFITGFPDETKSDLEKTLQCILNLALNGTYVQVSELSLLPGTPLYIQHKEKLKLDGNFSNFSKTICSKEEIDLISKYPHIFSSFYYLPVRSIKREKLVFINQIINKMSLFRNTMLLLAEHIEPKIGKTNILALAEKEFDRIQAHGKLQNPAVSHLINIINSIIEREKVSISSPYLTSVFNFEAYQALLKTMYSGWQHFKVKSEKININPNSFINLTPVWKTLTTTFNPEKIIQFINNPHSQKLTIRTGNFHFLLVATSEKDCKKLRINEKELYLLDQLSEVQVAGFIEKVNDKFTESETIFWLKKLRKLGVIEFRTLKTK